LGYFFGDIGADLEATRSNARTYRNHDASGAEFLESGTNNA
jgi:hypothetical protein